MGPPLSTWPYSHQYQSVHQKVPSDSEKVPSDNNNDRKCYLVKFMDTFRVICLNFTFTLLVVQVLFSLSAVKAGPVILNMDYMQGPVPIARNIRHLPCISRRTGQEGLCMFAIDCLKANGSHLGTCIDRFYFGSCCQIPDKTLLPQIIGNNIEDNTIDSGNFVHPQTEDKVQTTISKIPDIFPTRKSTTEKAITTVKAETVQDRTEPDSESNTDGLTTLNDLKVTTVVNVETTTKKQVTKATTQEAVTELPLKLSTFQTVSGDISNSVTEITTKTESTEIPKPTTVSTSTTTSTTIKPSRRPIKPTHKPFRPSNFSRPTIQTTTKPRPTKPILVYNTTRKPPYRPPPKRPSTKKPLPSPPRLNITILPQTTSTRPIFTRPSLSTITFINTTISSTEEPTTTTTMSTTTTTTTEPTATRTTTTVASTTSTTTESAPLVTERITELTEVTTETLALSTEPSSTTTTTTSKPTTTTTTTTTEIPQPPTTSTTESIKITTLLDEPVSEKETIKPVTTTETPSSTVLSSTISSSTLSSSTSSSTEYPPLVTWSTIDAVTKAPENTTTVTDENWSPITPPEGWILISTIPPTPESSSTSTISLTTTKTTTTTTSTTTTTTTTTEPPTTISDVPTTQETTVPITESPEKPTTEALSSEATTTSTQTTTVEATEAPILEFTVNVTLSPTMPTTTTIVPTTENVTEVASTTNATEETTIASNVTTVSPEINNTTDDSMFLPASVNMSDYKSVCGRRLWPLARIVGGTKSGFGQWPWQISLRQYRTSTYLHKCGAALLNENWAITAAHCVEHVPPSELLVRLGEYDLASESEPYGFAERRVQIVASHPHFDPATFEYDLALLRFYEPVKFQPNILPICVPDNDDDFVGKTAYVTGWGRLYDEGPLPSVLQEVQVPVINNTACESMYQEAGYNEHIPNIFICAGRRRGGADSCEGDSGGPMVVQRERDNRFVLGGVISWGIGCAEPNQPGVYTRISEFRDWINQILLF
ncbi:serine protease notopleural [Aphomia sociella]